MNASFRGPEPVLMSETRDEQFAADATAPEPQTQTQTQTPPERHDLRVLQALRRVIQAVDMSSRRLLAEHAITGPQLVCLTVLERHDRLTPTALAREVYLSPSTVVGVLDRLEQKGLVERARDGRDRRLRHVTVTESGRDLVERAPCPVHSKLVRGLRDLPPHEQASISSALDRIVSMMDAQDVDAAPMLASGAISAPPDS